MISIPWWLFGTCPNNDESHVTIELQSDSAAQTPIKEFKTPALSLTLPEEPSNLDVPSYKNFRANAKKRSSLMIEKGGEKRQISDSGSSVLHRVDTEVMQKTADGQETSEEDEFFGLDEDEVDSVVNTKIFPVTKTDEEFPAANITVAEQGGDEADSSLFYPMMFTSFDDPTAIFNTTIRGDIETSAGTSEWVFKGNEHLGSEDSINGFKSPGTSESSKRKREEKKEKRSLKRSRKSENSEEFQNRGDTVTSDIHDETLPIESLSNESIIVEKARTPKNSQSVVSLTRRTTPSRRAKTKVLSYRV